MDTQEAFVQAILDKPEDDFLRLVYADWLDEHGQNQRAEFIRVQIELEHLSEDDPKYWDLKTREEDLLTDHAANWVRELPQGVLGNTPIYSLINGAHFRRGFLAEIKPVWWPFKAEELFSVLPLQTLHLNMGYVPINFLTQVLPYCPWLARPWCLSLSGVEVQCLKALLDSPHLPRRLSLHGPVRAGAEVISLLASSPAACRVFGLELQPSPNHALQFQQLAATGWDQLETLGLDGIGLDDAGMQALAQSPHFPQLRSLSFSNCNDLTAVGWRALAQSLHLQKLQSLRLDFSRLDAAAWGEMSKAPNWPELKELSLVNCAVHSIKHLIDAAWMPQLRRLDCDGCLLEDESLAELLRSPNCAKLRIFLVFCRGKYIFERLRLPHCLFSG